MIRQPYALIAIAATAALVACGEKLSPSPPSVSPPANVTPAVPTPTPTATGTSPAETAKDSASTNPKETMSREQESKSMPMAGQSNNHSSTALDSKEAPKK